MAIVDEGLLKFILAELKVTGCGAAAIHKDPPGSERGFTLGSFHKLYDQAFEDVGEPRVVVAIGDFWGANYFIVDNVEHLWANAIAGKLAQHGISTVVAIPQGLWERLRPQIEDKIAETTAVPAAA